MNNLRQEKEKPMKSNICKIDSGFSKDRIFREVEKSAQYFELDKKSELQLRLLAEEVIGMLEEIVGRYEGDFWLEAEPEEPATGYWRDIHKVDFRLHVQLQVRLDEESREQLLSVASTGKNDPPKGSVLFWISASWIRRISPLSAHSVNISCPIRDICTIPATCRATP